MQDAVAVVAGVVGLLLVGATFIRSLVYYMLVDIQTVDFCEASEGGEVYDYL